MTRALLDVLIIHYPEDGVSAPFANALKRAFEFVRPDAAVSQFFDVEDPWERVFVSVCNSPELLEEALCREETHTLFVILLTDRLAESAEFSARLDEIADTLPRRESGTRSALCYSFSETAKAKLPARLRSRQVTSIGNLGEHQIGPHHLGLLALHRARLLLGQYLNASQLTIFISHAKADGIFFAQALKSSIDQIPELDVWYDAQNIESGSDWVTSIDDAASNSVFIALRTPAYDQRRVCREEFETALLHGVPIVVVDALSMSQTTGPSHLPFSSMPTVRIADGNTHRVLMAALREHLRILLMHEIAGEKSADCIGLQFRVWPRFPCLAAMTEYAQTSQYWLVPQSLVFDAEFLATRDWLASVGAELQLEILEQFRPLPS